VNGKGEGRSAKSPLSGNVRPGDRRAGGVRKDDIALAVVIVLVALAVAAAFGLLGGRRRGTAGARPAEDEAGGPRHGEVGAADSMNDRREERHEEPAEPKGFDDPLGTRVWGSASGSGASAAGGSAAPPWEPGAAATASQDAAETSGAASAKPSSHRAPAASPFDGVRSGTGPVLLAVAFALVVAVGVDVINDRQDAKPAKKATAQKAAETSGKVAPRFLVAVRRSGDAAVVRDVQTGEEVGVGVAAPQGQRWHQVASAGDGSYILSAYASGRITFHRLTLTSKGAPQELTQLPGLLVQGVSTARSDMAVSADGKQIAYLAYAPGTSRIEVVSTDGARRKQWTTRLPGRISSLSWAGDTLSFVWTTTRGTAVRRQVRTLDTTAAGGDLRASKPVLVLPAGGTAAVLSRDGRAVVAGVRSPAALTLQEFSVATGKPTKVVWTRKADRAGEISALSRHPESGRLLAAGTRELVYPGPDEEVRGLPAAGYTDVAW